MFREAFHLPPDFRSLPSMIRASSASAPVVCGLVLVVVLGAGSPSSAQTSTSGEAPDRPTIAAVLSGGGEKGLAHIGALQVFDELGVPFDVVAGTSAGSLVGSLYALGYRGEDIEAIVTRSGLSLNDVFLDQVDLQTVRLEERILPDEVMLRIPLDGFRPTLQTGVVAGQRVMQLLNLYSWGFHQVEDLTTLPRPFACNAVDMITGEDVILSTGFLPRVVRACISLPGIYRPVPRGDWLLVDGGLSHMLPIPEAAFLGSDVLIGVDVTGDVSETGEVQLGPEGNDRDFLALFLSNMGIERRRVAVAYRDSLNVVVDPDVRGVPPNDYDQAPLLIERGRAAGEAALPRLRALMDSLGNPAPRRAIPVPALSPVEVARLEVVGVEGDAERLVRRTLSLPIPGVLDPFQVDRAVTRLYGTRLFETVLYKVLPGAPGEPATLRIEVEPLTLPDRVGLGARYDDESGAAVLAVVELRNRLGYGSTTGLEVRLGRQARVAVSHVTRLGVTAPVTVGGKLEWVRTPVRFFALVSGGYPEEDRFRPTLEQNLGVASAFIGWTPGNALLAGLRGRAGVYGETVQTYPITDADLIWDGESFRAPDFIGARITGRYVSASAFLNAERWDRRSFPSKGFEVEAEVEIGTAARNDEELIGRVEDILGPVPRAPGFNEFQGFRHYLVSAEGAVPFLPGTSMIGRVTWVRGAGDGLPLHYLTAVGGMHPDPAFPGRAIPVMGLDAQARLASEGWGTRVAVQWEFVPDLFLTGVFEAGDAYFNLDDEEAADRPDLVPRSGFDLGRAAVGGGVEAGWASPVGPVVLAVGAADGGRLRLGLRAGYAF